MSTPLPTRREAALRLHDIHVELGALYGDYTEALIAEREAKASVYRASSSPSASGRDGEASAFSIDQTTDVLRLHGQIRELEEERDHLRFLIQHGVLMIRPSSQ